MGRQISILSPLDLQPGSVSPEGRTIAKAEMFENPEKRALIVGVTYDDGKVDAFLWPLGYGWTIRGTTIPLAERGDDG